MYSRFLYLFFFYKGHLSLKLIDISTFKRLPRSRNKVPWEQNTILVISYHCNKLIINQILYKQKIFFSGLCGLETRSECQHGRAVFWDAGSSLSSLPIPFLRDPSSWSHQLTIAFTSKYHHSGAWVSTWIWRQHKF